MVQAPTEMAAEIDLIPTASQSTFWRRFSRHRLAQVGMVLVGLLILTALFASVIAPHNPQELLKNGISNSGQPHPPGAGFLLGADSLGRDIFSRVIFGTRISLLVAMIAMFTSVILGTTVGLLGGYFEGWVDILLTRFTESVMSLPTILLAIALFVVLPGDSSWQRLFKLLLAISLVTWTGIARAVRGVTLSLKKREYVEAARALGCSHDRIIFKHLLPNVMPTVIVMATLAVAQNILLEAGLSYLGQGVDPSVASWGSMIKDGEPFLLAAPWMVLVPGIAIVLAVTGFNLLGRAMEETLEPRR
jgi:ABC-type dipeptide/oligopeptide/nickel transport system permease subunit